jgi:cardiolipin synthase
MRRAGVEVLRFRPEISWLTLRRTRLRRLHRKLAVVDGHTGFVGGINIINDIPAGTDMAPRLDYAVEVQGEVVRHINAVMRRLWVTVSWMSFRSRRHHVKLLHRYTHSAQSKVVFLLRDNLRHRRSIEQAYLKAIEGAQQEIILASAYFIPGKRLRNALQNAVQRGVRVQLLLQGRVEYHLPHYAALALYDDLLGAGVEIHEYHVSFLHAKAAVVDGYWATVGSSNIDPFSLWLAREANLVVQDGAFAQSLRASLLHEMEHAARPVLHADWRKQGLWTHLRARASYLFVQFLAGVVGYTPWRDDNW